MMMMKMKILRSYAYYIQGSAKKWSLGCVVPASWLPLATGWGGARFTDIVFSRSLYTEQRQNGTCESAVNVSVKMDAGEYDPGIYSVSFPYESSSCSIGGGYSMK